METSFTDTLFCSHSGSYFSARCQGLKADLQRHDKSPSRSEIAPSANVPHGSGTHFCPSSDKDRSRTFSFFFFSSLFSWHSAGLETTCTKSPFKKTGSEISSLSRCHLSSHWRDTPERRGGQKQNQTWLRYVRCVRRRGTETQHWTKLRSDLLEGPLRGRGRGGFSD